MIGNWEIYGWSWSSCLFLQVSFLSQCGSQSLNTALNLRGRTKHKSFSICCFSPIHFVPILLKPFFILFIYFFTDVEFLWHISHLTFGYLEKIRLDFSASEVCVCFICMRVGGCAFAKFEIGAVLMEKRKKKNYIAYLLRH